MYKIPDNKILLLFFAPAVFLFIILLLLGQNFIFSFYIVAVYCIFATALVSNKTGLFLLLFFRPCLDYFLNDAVSVFNFEINMAGLFSVLAIFFTLFVIIKNSTQTGKFPLVPAWLFFMAVALASLFFSVDAGASLVQLSRYLSTVLIFYASFILIKNNSDLANLIKTIVASAIIPALVAIYQYFTGTGLTYPYEGIYNRVFGTFAQPNILAFYLVLAIALCLAIFLSGDKKKISILLYGLLAGLYLVTLAFTYTRSAWLGLLLVVIMLGIARYRKFLIIALIFLTICFFSIQQINTRLQSLTVMSASSSVQFRLNLWSDGIGYFLQRPVIGYGVGTSNEVVLDKRGPSFGSPDAHNDYLRVAIDTGTIGLISFLLLTISLISTLLANYRRQSKPRLKTLSFVILMIAVCFSLISFGDNVLVNTALEWALWAVFGGILAIQKFSPTAKTIRRSQTAV
jgi:O-antigen ligase